MALTKPGTEQNDSVVNRQVGNTVKVQPALAKPIYLNGKFRGISYTLNNHSEQQYLLLKNIGEEKTCVRYSMQEEIAPTTGTPHIQGYFEFKNNRALSGFQRKFPGIHVEKANNMDASFNYGLKDESRKPGGKRDSKVPRTMKCPLGGNKPYPWQQQLLDICAKEPDDRTLRWYYDEEGDSGKTSIAKYIHRLYPDEMLFLQGKGEDIKYMVKNFIEGGNNLKIAIFGYPRSKQAYVSYEALESIKDAFFASGKYESAMVDSDPPHVIILANFRPDESQMSKDRWVITKIEHCVKPHVNIDKKPQGGFYENFDNEIKKVTEDIITKERALQTEIKDNIYQWDEDSDISDFILDI